MRKIQFLIAFFGVFAFVACDKVENPYVVVPSTELNETLFPGNFEDYPWPVFTENTNTNRNVLVEDYTGHTCVFCPQAADIAHQLEVDNPGRVFVASIHAGPSATGVVGFQLLELPIYAHDFTNPVGKAYGIFFANGYGFSGNPRGTINRKVFNDFIFQSPNNWTSQTNTTLAENDLKVNLQSKINFYPTTRGAFVHTEVDVLEPISDDLAVVTYFLEHSFVAPQKKQGVGDILDYNHHNVHRGNIDGLPWGRTLTDELKDANGKYYLDYSYQIPAQYDPSNCLIQVYVYNKTTLEILQVIEVPIVE